MVSVQGIERIYPSAADLQTVETNLKCTEEGCMKTFHSKSNFVMHLLKHHKRKNLEKVSDSNSTRQYFCPAESCCYSKSRHFKKLSYLKQHFLKVHAEKSFICSSCNKGFPTESCRNAHENFCNVKFACSDCANEYSSYEALLTHSKRQNHSIMHKSAFAIKTVIKKPADQIPKQIYNVHVFIPLNKVLCSSETQTDKAYSVKRHTRSKISKRQVCRETQTMIQKGIKSSIETQTTANCTLKKVIKSNDEKQSNVETQTKVLDDLCIANSIFENWSTCSTQTKMIETSSPSFLSSKPSLGFEFDDSSKNDINCDIETQTDSFLEEIMPTENLDVYTNMYTQTGGDDYLFSELCFNDTQTQTNWPDYDMLVSQETQTYLLGDTQPSTCRETTHMETQTEICFRQMLEEINA